MAAPLAHDTPLQRVLSRLPGYKRNGKGYIARCPAHEDRTPSLSIATGKDGRVLLTCHANCTLDDIVAALGLTLPDIFPPAPYKYTPPPATSRRPILESDEPSVTYDYVDGDGKLLYQVCRYEPKGFNQRRPDGKGGWIKNLDGVPRVLYRLPDIIEACALGKPIYVCEGEKDADAIAELGYIATTNMGGSNGWRDEYASALRGSTVYVFPDNDDAGRSRAEHVAASCASQDCVVKVVALPGLSEKGDVSDWLADESNTLDDLDRIVGQAPVWCPDPSKRTRWRLDEILANDDIMRPPPPIVPYIAWAGRSTLLAAGEKLGKSTLVGFTASQVTRGEEFLGEPVPGGTVLIVGLEEAMGDAARRLRNFGASAKRLYYVNRLPGNPPERIQALREHIEATKPVLVIVDTLIAYGDTTVTDWASSAQAAPIVNALTSVAHETGVALVLVHHAKKSDGKYRDSSAIGGAVDIIAEMQAPDVEKDPTLRKLNVRGRLGMYYCQFRFDGDTYVIDRGDEAPLEYRILEFVRNKVKCSVRDVVGGVKGKAETIQSSIVHMLADGRLVNLTPDRSHASLMVPDRKQGSLTWES